MLKQLFILILELFLQ